MKTFVRLCISSAIFGIVIAGIYYAMSREAIGTLLLGIMGAALLFAAGYALAAERDAKLAGDDEDALPADAAGETLGIFTGASAWPILIAACVAFFLFGVLWSPLLAALALIGALLCFWRMGAESSRT